MRANGIVSRALLLAGGNKISPKLKVHAKSLIELAERGNTHPPLKIAFACSTPPCVRVPLDNFASRYGAPSTCSKCSRSVREAREQRQICFKHLGYCVSTDRNTLSLSGAILERHIKSAKLGHFAIIARAGCVGTTHQRQIQLETERASTTPS